jgi:DNA helicase-2/ATP-dependent DNA helicase PcrA
MKERAFTQIYNYFKQNRREMQQIIETEVDIMIEKDSYILTGRIDLLRESNGMLELLDFKTEARPPLDTIKLVDYERQLCTYAHALEWRYGRRPERLLLYWTQEALREDALMEIHYRPEVVEQVERSFTTVVNKIRGKDFRIITVPERKICAHCDMYHYCLNEGTIAPYVQAETMLSM